jgi:hypothetical protein
MENPIGKDIPPREPRTVTMMNSSLIQNANRSLHIDDLYLCSLVG